MCLLKVSTASPSHGDEGRRLSSLRSCLVAYHYVNKVELLIMKASFKCQMYGGFFLACRDFRRMFDHPFHAYACFFLFFLKWRLSCQMYTWYASVASSAAVQSERFPNKPAPVLKNGGFTFVRGGKFPPPIFNTYF